MSRTQQRYAHHLLHRMQARPDDYTWANQTWPQIKRMWHWAQSSTETDLIVAYNRQFQSFMDDSGKWREAIDWGEHSLATAKTPAEQLALLDMTALAYYRCEQFAECLVLTQKGLTLATQMANTISQASLLDRLGLAHHGLFQYEQAIDYHQRAIKLAQQTNNKQLQVYTLGNLGLVYIHLQEHVRAQIQFEKAASLLDHHVLPETQQFVHNNLGLLRFYQDDHRAAATHYEAALAIAERMQTTTAAVPIWINLGNARLDALLEYIEKQDTLPTAEMCQSTIVCYEKAVELERTIGSNRHIGAALSGLGTLHRLQQNDEVALDYYQQAQAIHHKKQEWVSEASDLRWQSILHLNHAQWDEAIRCQTAAYKIYLRVNHQHRIASSEQALGSLHNAIDQPADAEGYYLRSLTNYEALDDRVRQAEIYAQLGSLYANCGQFWLGIEHSQQAAVMFSGLQIWEDEIAAVNDLGRWYMELYRWHSAEQCFQYGLILAHHQQDNDYITILNENLSMVGRHKRSSWFQRLYQQIRPW